eukprot:gene5501-5380_t
MSEYGFASTLPIMGELPVLTADFSHVGISTLNLSHTGITELPAGLLNIDTLTDVDLSHNAITEMPAELMEVHPDRSDGFDFSGNPFSEESLQRIAAYFRKTGNDLNIDGIANRPAAPDEAPDIDMED